MRQGNAIHFRTQTVGRELRFNNGEPYRSGEAASRKCGLDIQNVITFIFFGKNHLYANLFKQITLAEAEER